MICSKKLLLTIVNDGCEICDRRKEERIKLHQGADWGYNIINMYMVNE